MINLTCPSCRSELSIDEGFRGGVCRCFNCGTMMTVPEDPDNQPAESLDRPSTPSDQTAAVASRPSKPAAPAGKTAAARAHAPVRRKSSQIKLFILGIFLLIIGGMVGLVVYGAMLMRESKPTVVVITGVDAHKSVFDIVENPYLGNHPQFMGIPAADTNVWMIDSSVAMRDFFDFAKAAVAVSLPKLGAYPVQVILWNEAGPIAAPDAPDAAQSINVADVTAKLDGVLPSGGISAKPAFELALKSKPKQITLVCRNAPEEAEIKELSALLGTGKETKLFIIQFDSNDQALDFLARQTGGRLANVSIGQIQRWYQEYSAQKQ